MMAFVQDLYSDPFRSVFVRVTSLTPNLYEHEDSTKQEAVCLPGTLVFYTLCNLQCVFNRVFLKTVQAKHQVRYTITSFHALRYAIYKNANVSKPGSPLARPGHPFNVVVSIYKTLIQSTYSKSTLRMRGLSSRAISTPYATFR